MCWDVACGAGVHAATIAGLGWTVVGADLSRGQLRHARQRTGALAVADATALPCGDASVDAVVSVACHTDVDDYAAVCREAARILRPGGRFAHVGLHPCFCGGFADRSRPDHVVVDAAYWQRERRFDGWTTAGVRGKVGAVQRTIGDLVSDVVGAGLVIDSVHEFGEPAPDVLAIASHRPNTAA